MPRLTYLQPRLAWQLLLSAVITITPIGYGTQPIPTSATSPFEDSGIAFTNVLNGSVAWGDYDADGDLDVVLTGESGGTGISKIYRNDGGNVFTNIVAALVGVHYSSASWGDYDGDNDLDLLLSGTTYGTAGIAKIYRNDGDDIFTDSGAVITPVYYSSGSWADYDNDGDLDILLAGRAGSGPGSYVAITKIYRNDGDNSFFDIHVDLQGVFLGSANWGDYDNDGDPDVLLTGCPDGEYCVSRSTKLYRNDGYNVFTDISTNLPDVARGAAVWGDYDSDGDLDILLTGFPSAYTRVTQIYRNNGNDFFSDIFAGLPGAGYSTVAWGDYDNDGDLDVLFAGCTDSSCFINTSAIYRNDGNSTFTDIGAGFTGVFDAALAWGDYDNDGRLDVFLTGCTQPYCTGLTRLYHNLTPLSNTIPTAPVGLTSNIYDSSATLQWSVAGDLQTPASGLSYNLRIGTTPEGGQFRPPMSLANGYRQIPKFGNTDHNRTITITNLLRNADYYWSVQSVDTALGGSPFASEEMFTTPPPTVQFSNAIFSVSEETSIIPITITLDAPSAITATISYSTTNGTAINGEDFLGVSGVVTLTPGMTTTIFTIEITNDLLIEADETIILNLSDPFEAILGTPNTAVITILSDDFSVLFLPFVRK